MENNQPIFIISRDEKQIVALTTDIFTFDLPRIFVLAYDGSERELTFPEVMDILLDHYQNHQDEALTNLNGDLIYEEKEDAKAEMMIAVGLYFKKNYGIRKGYLKYYDRDKAAYWTKVILKTIYSLDVDITPDDMDEYFLGWEGPLTEDDLVPEPMHGWER